MCVVDNYNLKRLSDLKSKRKLGLISKQDFLFELKKLRKDMLTEALFFLEDYDKINLNDLML
ncbi:MAG: hypothetical protein N4A40_13690 [Tissierellales bacterium]|jgi:hypothetical protein|nr:hypothetical protein [Tissierellales bacterium]